MRCCCFSQASRLFYVALAGTSIPTGISLPQGFICTTQTRQVRVFYGRSLPHSLPSTKRRKPEFCTLGRLPTLIALNPEGRLAIATADWFSLASLVLVQASRILLSSSSVGGRQCHSAHKKLLPTTNAHALYACNVSFG